GEGKGGPPASRYSCSHCSQKTYSSQSPPSDIGRVWVMISLTGPAVPHGFGVGLGQAQRGAPLVSSTPAAPQASTSSVRSGSPTMRRGRCIGSLLRARQHGGEVERAHLNSVAAL